MVGAYVRVDDTLDLVSMWLPFARGHGVGDAAVRAILRWADPREVVLSVKADNKPAMALPAPRVRRRGQAPDDADERLMRRSPDTAGTAVVPIHKC
jgi:GNAT superfamily N-acetyltransferase